MSRTSILAVWACLAWILACGGSPPEGGECCTVDDVIRLSQEGTSDELIVATLRTTGVDLALTTDDITRMSQAGVSDAVIDVANGGPCVCEVPPEPEPEPVATGPKPKGPPPLKLAVRYSGGKSFELVNTSNTDYTNVTVVLNDEYQYRLKKLKNNAGDFMRITSFVSRRTGAEANRKVRLRKVSVRADQGTYVRTF